MAVSHSDPDQKGQGDRRRGVLQEAVARSATGSNCQWCYKVQLPMIGLWHEEVDDPQAELEESHRRVAIVAELRRPGRSPVGRPRSAVSKSRTKRRINASGRGEGFAGAPCLHARAWRTTRLDYENGCDDANADPECDALWRRLTDPEYISL